MKYSGFVTTWRLNSIKTTRLCKGNISHNEMKRFFSLVFSRCNLIKDRNKEAVTNQFHSNLRIYLCADYDKCISVHCAISDLFINIVTRQWSAEIRICCTFSFAPRKPIMTHFFFLQSMKSQLTCQAEPRHSGRELKKKRKVLVTILKKRRVVRESFIEEKICLRRNCFGERLYI